MARQKRPTPIRKRGRPKTTGRGAGVLVRLHPDAMKSLDRWSAQQEDAPSRPEAIRRLVGMGLASMGPAATKTSRKAAARAAGLAGEMIDNLVDQSASADIREERKRRLLKGPPEFRGIRSDLPKAKR